MILLHLLTLASFAMAEQIIFATTQYDMFTDVLITNVNRRDAALGVQNWSTQDNAKITLHERHWGTNQLWTMSANGQISLKYSNKCMVPMDDGIGQIICDSDQHLAWQYEVSTKRLIHSLSGKCLTLPDDTSNNVKPRLFDCGNGWQQQWIPTASYMVSNGSVATLTQGSRMELSRYQYALELEKGKLSIYNVSTGRIAWTTGDTTGSECTLWMLDAIIEYRCNYGQQLVWREDDGVNKYPCKPPQCVNAEYMLYLMPDMGLSHIRHTKESTVTLWRSGLGNEPGQDFVITREWCLCTLSVPDHLNKDEECLISGGLKGPSNIDCKKLQL